ncbi:hypothetical protein [Kutzneria chonburiensis]|uniref:DUF385 domain-containing protein n=1 Tax=Kutzneria chonburiensis TaxID=1483604 RepID=A0ABV6N9P2_9PSEU|nr:hypothetical protein [Kutzneria chonburiensis]
MNFQGTVAGRVVSGFNGRMLRLRSSRLFGRVVRRYLTEVSYTGRRSGRTFSTPVAYKRAGAVVTIQVMMADSKSWWRNFTGDGGPLTVDLPGGPVTGHAVAQRLRKNRVDVTVTV